MHSRTAASGAAALAAFILAFTAACGTEVAAPSNDIGGADPSSPSSVERTGVPGCFHSTADAAAESCKGTADGNRARLDFGDDGRG